MQIVGSTHITPPGVCDPCSGDGETEGPKGEITPCKACDGKGGTDKDAVDKYRRFNGTLYAALSA